ncbi:MAG: hypothetical protein IJR58_05290, partial [Lachnospiraceae bacterium]|nr:hypothetical protein [Lachnospiraceae bacterium]
MKRLLKQLTGILFATAIVLSPVATITAQAAGAGDFKSLTKGTTIPPRYANYNIKVSILGDGIPIRLPVSDSGFDAIYGIGVHLSLTDSAAVLKQDLVDYTTNFDDISSFYALCYYYEMGMDEKSAKAFGQRFAKTELQSMKDVNSILTPLNPEVNVLLKAQAHDNLYLAYYMQGQVIRFQSEYLYEYYTALADYNKKKYNEYIAFHNKNNNPNAPADQTDAYIAAMQLGALPIDPWSARANTKKDMQACLAELNRVTVAAQTAPVTANTPATQKSSSNAPASGNAWAY